MFNLFAPCWKTSCWHYSVFCFCVKCSHMHVQAWIHVHLMIIACMWCFALSSFVHFFLICLLLRAFSLLHKLCIWETVWVCIYMFREKASLTCGSLLNGYLLRLPWSYSLADQLLCQAGFLFVLCTSIYHLTLCCMLDMHIHECETVMC